MNNITKAKAAIMLMFAIVLAAGCNKEQKAEVKTSQVTNVTSSTATVGGMVVSDGNSAIIERGICWAKGIPNPDINNYHMAVGSGIGSFTCEITGLEASTAYTVCAYALNGIGISYGLPTSFTTLTDNGGGGNGNESGGTYYGHDYVDLGLPSGTLWATCNVGAHAPEMYGGYFAWGETTTKGSYEWSNYKYGYLDDNYELCLSKYNTNAFFGPVDNLTMLQPEDDAATVNWGGRWHTPTKEQWQELKDNTTSTWTMQNGANGRLFTANNGQSLFLPAAGHYYEEELDFGGRFGRYWSNSLCDYPGRVWALLYTDESIVIDDGFYRFYGFSIRPVCPAE